MLFSPSISTTTLPSLPSLPPSLPPSFPSSLAFCYTAPLGSRLFLRPFGPHPVGLYKASDDDAASPFSNTSPCPPSPFTSSSSPSSSSLSSSLPLSPLSFPPSSATAAAAAAAAAAAVALPYVHIEEAAHPLRERSLRRSFSYFCSRVQTIFSPSTTKNTTSSSSSSSSTAASSLPSSSSSSPSIWPRLKEITKPEVPLLCLSALALLVAAAVEVSLPHYSSQALSAILQNKGQPEFFKAVRRVLELGTSLFFPPLPPSLLVFLALFVAAAVQVSLPHCSSQALSAILQNKGQPEFFKAAVRRVLELCTSLFFYFLPPSFPLLSITPFSTQTFLLISHSLPPSFALPSSLPRSSCRHHHRCERGMLWPRGDSHRVSSILISLSPLPPSFALPPPQVSSLPSPPV